MGSFEITKREVLVSVIIAFVMVGIGFLISSSIHDHVTSSNGKYFKSLKVDDDEELFNYAIDTEVGNMVSYGTVKANNPVSDERIDGDYFSLIKIEEHYVMKTRTVTYTDAKGNMQTRTETYWEWDEVDRKHYNTDTFTYLGRTFEYDDIEFNNYSYIDTVKDSSMSSTRYVYRAIPKEFSGSLYSKALNKSIESNEFHEDKTIKELMDGKEKQADTSVFIFWCAWIALIVIVLVVFVALENRYLD